MGKGRALRVTPLVHFEPTKQFGDTSGDQDDPNSSEYYCTERPWRWRTGAIVSPGEILPEHATCKEDSTEGQHCAAIRAESTLPSMIPGSGERSRSLQSPSCA